MNEKSCLSLRIFIVRQRFTTEITLCSDAPLIARLIGIYRGSEEKRIYRLCRSWIKHGSSLSEEYELRGALWRKVQKELSDKAQF